MWWHIWDLITSSTANPRTKWWRGVLEGKKPEASWLMDHEWWGRRGRKRPMQFNGIWIKSALMGFGCNCGFECLPASLVCAGTAWVDVSCFASTPKITLECCGQTGHLISQKPLPGLSQLIPVRWWESSAWNDGHRARGVLGSSGNLSHLSSEQAGCFFPFWTFFSSGFFFFPFWNFFPSGIFFLFVSSLRPSHFKLLLFSWGCWKDSGVFLTAMPACKNCRDNTCKCYIWIKPTMLG